MVPVSKSRDYISQSHRTVVSCCQLTSRLSAIVANPHKHIHVSVHCTVQTQFITFVASLQGFYIVKVCRPSLFIFPGSKGKLAENGPNWSKIGNQTIPSPMCSIGSQ